MQPDDLDEQIAFHERALGVRCDSRTPIPEAGLELATVGNLLLIANPRQPGEIARATAYTLLVASVADYLAGLEGAGVEVTEPVSTSAPGNRTRIRHPDGTPDPYRRSSPSTDGHAQVSRPPPFRVRVGAHLH